MKNRVNRSSWLMAWLNPRQWLLLVIWAIIIFGWPTTWRLVKQGENLIKSEENKR